MQKCSNHWCRIGTTQVVNSSLANGTSSNVVSLIETYKYNNCSSWITQNRGENKGTNSCAVAGNGLMYTTTSSRMVKNSAVSYCNNLQGTSYQENGDSSYTRHAICVK